MVKAQVLISKSGRVWAKLRFLISSEAGRGQAQVLVSKSGRMWSRLKFLLLSEARCGPGSSSNYSVRQGVGKVQVIILE